MNDKEKSAIETIRDLKCLKWYEHAFDNGTEVLEEEEKQDIDVVLNLIEKQSKEIEELQVINQMQKYRIEVMDERELISRDEVEEIIKTRIKEIQNMYDKLSKNPKEHLHSKTEYLIVICELQSILNEIKGDDK